MARRAERRISHCTARFRGDVDEASTAAKPKTPCADRPHHQRRARSLVAGAADVPVCTTGISARNGTSKAVKARTWEGIESVDDGELWETHLSLKARLLEFVRRRAHEAGRAAQRTRRRYRAAGSRVLSPDALTIGFARRFATYKRANLMLADIERLAMHGERSQASRAVCVRRQSAPAGRAGQASVAANCGVDARLAKFADKLVFVEDYDINVGRHLVQGVDVWLNNPRRPL
jgi:starch phosphorylase